ncbi:MAG: DUF2225 domain-containing protein [Planctomycetota bacterium]|jgi:hypothetical protein|nr:DUF2225 domain-containing protein [Planctomycetota bacterium]
MKRLLIILLLMSPAMTAENPFDQFAARAAAEKAAPKKSREGAPDSASSRQHAGEKNVCPVCGRERSVCYAESLAAAQNPNGGAKACPVYKDSFVVGESRPAPCPICGLLVNLPQRNQRYENTDSDLCPHPSGNVRYMPEIVTCPRCGFSAFQRDFRAFRAKQHPEIAQWVKQNLQPSMPEILHQLLGREIKIDAQNLVALFELQKEIPDILRCGNAFLLYRERLRRGDPDVNELGLARVAWLAAWANRRAISAPFGEGVLLDSARRALAAIQKSETGELESAAAVIDELLADGARFDIIERQLLRLTQAGYYNRLGLNAAAQTALEQVLVELRKKHLDAASDPWQKIKIADGVQGEEKEKIIALAKKALNEEVAVRGNCLRQEIRYLTEAAQLLTTAVEKRQAPSLDLPTYLYLVGDFERRAEQHARALLWLTAAERAADNGTVKLEHLASAQIELLKRYVRERQITPAPNPRAATDMLIINAAGLETKNAQAAAQAQSIKIPAESRGQ